MESILEVNNLSVRYGSTMALNDVSFVMRKGDYVALAGPNGAGKTTLMEVALGLEKRSSGTVKLFGTAVEQFSDWHKIGYLSQRVDDFNPLFPATAQEVVGLGLLSQKKYPKTFNRADERRIVETLELLDVADLKDHAIATLSGGQQQRIFLARALVAEPELLVLDEPTTALDPETREHFFRLLERLNAEKKTTIIIITHDTSQVGKHAGILFYLDKRVVFFGSFSGFCHSTEMERRFGRFSQHHICHQHEL